MLVSNKVKTRSLVLRAGARVSSTSLTQSKSDLGPGRAEVEKGRNCLQGAQCPTGHPLVTLQNRASIKIGPGMGYGDSAPGKGPATRTSLEGT